MSVGSHGFCYCFVYQCAQGISWNIDRNECQMKPETVNDFMCDYIQVMSRGDFEFE